MLPEPTAPVVPWLPRAGRVLSGLLPTLTTIVVVITALKLGASLIVPAVLGTLIACGLDPLVRGLRRFGLPRWLAAALIVSSTVLSLASLTYSMSDGIARAVTRLPAATGRLRDELRSIRIGYRPVRAIERAVDNLEAAAVEVTGGTARPEAAAPALRLRQSMVSGSVSLLGLTSTVAAMILYVYILLASGERLKRKLVRLAGPSLARRRALVSMMRDIDATIERFLWIVASTNLVVAAVTWMAFLGLGVANAGVWAIVGGVLNTIPFFGSAAAAGIFLLAGLLQFDGLGPALLMVGAFLLVTTVEGTLLTPWLLGRTMRINHLAIFGGLVFWSWVWGPWGLVLAFPIMMVAKTIADRVEALHPVGEILGR